MGNKNILILEDSEYRIAWFKETFSDYELFITDEVDAAHNFIKKNDFKLIFLDRDLGFNKKSGEHFTRLMMKDELCKNSSIVIHSSNPQGVVNMKSDLDKYHKDVNVINFIQLIQMDKSDFKIL